AGGAGRVAGPDRGPGRDAARGGDAGSRPHAAADELKRFVPLAAWQGGSRKNLPRRQRGQPMKEPFFMFTLNAGPLPEVMAQRSRDYARQRQMTLSDLLLENRIIFFGSVGNTIAEAVISDPLANATIQQLLYLQYESRNQEIHFYINSP